MESSILAHRLRCSIATVIIPTLGTYIDAYRQPGHTTDTHPLAHVRLKVLFPGNIYTHTTILEIPRRHFIALTRDRRDDHVGYPQAVGEVERRGRGDVMWIIFARRRRAFRELDDGWSER